MSWLIRGLGIAGFAGFEGSADHVHNVASPETSCDACQEHDALIHNVVSKYLGHSDTFVGTGYAEVFWLPFLWGIDPTDYKEFIDYCNAAAGFEREWSKQTRGKGHVDPRLLTIEEKLRNRTWRWSGPFGAYVEQEVLSRFPGTHEELQDSVSLAIRGTWLNVISALEAHQARADRIRKTLPPDSKADEAIAYLNPHLAVRRAVELLPER